MGLLADTGRKPKAETGTKLPAPLNQEATTMRKAPKLEAARAVVEALWSLMCQEDGIDPAATFVSFSPNNPHSGAYFHAMKTFQRLLKAQKQRTARRDAIASLGMKEVRGALGGRYIE
jgi:hypothetical protein